MKNTNKLLLIVALLVTSLSAFSQDLSTSDFHLGIGVGENYNDYYKDLDVTIPSIIASWEKPFYEDLGPGRITGGGFLAFSQRKTEWAYYYENYTVTYSYLNVGARGSYVLNPFLGDKLEPYGGIQLIYSYLFYSLENEDGESYDDFADASGGEVDLSVFIGSRFMITQNFGAFLELDPLFVVAKLGIVLKHF